MTPDVTKTSSNNCLSSYKDKQGNFYVITSSVNRLVWAVMPLLLRFSTKVKEFLVFKIRPTLCICLKS